MSNTRFKEHLSKLDSSTRICMLYLEKLVNEKFQSILSQIPKQKSLDLTILDPKFNSLQNQITGIKHKLILQNTVKELENTFFEYRKKIEILEKTLTNLLNESLIMVTNDIIEIKTELHSNFIELNCPELEEHSIGNFLKIPYSAALKWDPFNKELFPTEKHQKGISILLGRIPSKEGIIVKPFKYIFDIEAGWTIGKALDFLEKINKQAIIYDTTDFLKILNMEKKQK